MIEYYSLLSFDGILFNRVDEYGGRTESILQEKEVINSIINNGYSIYNRTDKYDIYLNEFGVKIIIPNNDRFWFDIGVILNNQFYPINIKISNGNTQDNVFGLNVLSYLIFGNNRVDETGVHLLKNSPTEYAFAEKIVETINIIDKSFLDFNNDYNIDNIRDYFLLVIDKNTKNINLIPFLMIQEHCIKTNPKNIFQINFNKITLDYDRTYDEYISKIIKKYYEYTMKKASPYLALNPFFNN